MRLRLVNSLLLKKKQKRNALTIDWLMVNAPAYTGGPVQKTARLYSDKLF